MRKLILFLSMAILSTPAMALRCGGSIISEGDSTLHLTQRCGEPTMIEQHQQRIPVTFYDHRSGNEVTEYELHPYEVWTYNFGRRRFISRIRIENGTVRHIETGGYGY